jgi:hypothetical protein
MNGMPNPLHYLLAFVAAMFLFVIFIGLVRLVGV